MDWYWWDDMQTSRKITGTTEFSRLKVVEYDNNIHNDCIGNQNNRNHLVSRLTFCHIIVCLICFSMIVVYCCMDQNLTLMFSSTFKEVGATGRTGTYPWGCVSNPSYVTDVSHWLRSNRCLL